MAIPRLYCPQPIAPGAALDLPDALAHHVRVLRLAEGDPIVLFDGHGGEFTATLAFEGKAARALLGDRSDREAELAGRLTLLQAIPAGDKMDWIVEKAVELGVYRLQPVAARRSVTQLSGNRLEKRMLHWQRIIAAACEQCGRNRLMQLDPPRTLAETLTLPGSDPRFMCDPAAPLDLATARSRAGSPVGVELMVGPEGGWDNEELAIARRAGVDAVRFGSRVLRTETAGLALVAAVTALLGW